MTAMKLIKVQELASKSGLRTTKPIAAMMTELGSESKQGLLVYGRTIRGVRGAWHQYLVFDESGLVAVGSEQGNYAGGIDWRRVSNEPWPSLTAELQALLSAVR